MVTKRPLFYWVKSTNLKLQALLLLLIIVTVGTRVLPLEMQKRIVNEAISHNKVDLLLLYCGLYLAAIVVAGILKYCISVLQTYIGQQALALIRKDLYGHILSLPLQFFRKISPGTVVSALVTELASVGEFVAQAIAVPITNFLTLLAFGAYMFYLNPLLALLSMATYPIVAIAVPRLQRKSNAANKMRIDTTSQMSGKIGEVISGIHEIHSNGSFHLERTKFGSLVDQLFRIRVTWILYKQGAKALNSFLQNLGPFTLFLVGGYLAISGRFNLGALVAFLSAYEKLYDPWKEIMDFYQLYQDTRVGYKRIMQFFDDEPEYLLEPPDRSPYALKGAITVKNVSFTVGNSIHLLKRVSLDLEPGKQLALVGFSGSGKSTLAQCIGQLYKYTGGTLQIDGLDVSELTKRDIVENVGIVSQSPYVFDGTIKENLLYSCEALTKSSTGTVEYPMPTLDEVIQVVQQVGLFVDVLRFGLNTTLGENEQELMERLVRVRHHFQAGFGAELAEDVEFFDEQRYLQFSSVAANIIFGNAEQESFSVDRLPGNEYFLGFLDEAQLKTPLISLGKQLAIQVIDILGEMSLDEALFQRSPMRAEEFEDYKALVARIRHSHLHEIPEEDRHALLRLALRFIPGEHNLAILPGMLQGLILESRFLFRERISRDHPKAITSYRMTEFLHKQTILENILFGRPMTDHSKVQERINQTIIQLFIEEDLLERIVEIGMDFRVGSKGDRLSGGQRQKLAIARVLLKNPAVMIMDEATSALDNASQQRIQQLIEKKLKGKNTIISVVHRLDTIKGYDRIAVMKAGKIVESGSYEELIAQKGMLYELVHGPGAAC
jgi:ABC-type multidrug transport system fused ATPase/permease subunit